MDSNRLSEEKSPYLLKHAHNPVDWYPWGEEAFSKAKNDNKPVFLSIGYSSCHWCNVMEKESFEDPSTAALINRGFIPIKVDREERPEVDAYYMAAVQALTGGGGWPLSVFLTPDLKPYYGGTYFPPEPRDGYPSFRQVLDFALRVWKEKRGEVTEKAELLSKEAEKQFSGARAEAPPGLLQDACSTMVSSFDQTHGGFGGAPKFPLPLTLMFLLRHHYRTGNGLALTCVTKTLDAMAAGGIRDHVGGGFHRYSTDRVWLVPHFEKMLYDNALLLRAYSEAYLATGKSLYAEVARETAGWLTGEMTQEGGGFSSAQDADTEEGEGSYYTWTPGEVKDALGPEAGAEFCDAYGVTQNGNFEGRTILSSKAGTSVPQASKAKLYGARLMRPRPMTDSKVLASWNGLAVSGMAVAGRALGDRQLIDRAVSAADFVVREMTKDGDLLRRYYGGNAGLPGTLEDYSFLMCGLADLFEATGDPRWLAEASRTGERMIEYFEDPENGGFFMTREGVPVRMKEGYDGPTPSGNSAAAYGLVRLSELTGVGRFRESAKRAATAFGADLESNPGGHPLMLAALDSIVNGTKEVVISAPGEKEASAFVRVLSERFFPDVVLLKATRATFQKASAVTSVLEGREPGRKARGYVCVRSVCKVPAETPRDLLDQLTAAGR
jgi:uncharacterized protein